MTPRAKPRRPTAAASPFSEYGLAALGLTPGDAVRFRRHETQRWSNATVARREKDGSIGLHDSRGAARSITIDNIEVRTAGPRGGTIWEPLTERSARTEQLQLVDPPSTRRVGRATPMADVAMPEQPDEHDEHDEPYGQLRLL